MYLKLITNDMRKSKSLTVTIAFFIAAAAMLVSQEAILIANLSVSINRLMDKARTPHFMQMHSGFLDVAGITDFASQNDDIEDYQIQEFLNVDGSHLIIGEKSMGDSVQDNGFSYQSTRFDFLLDLEEKIIDPLEGEVYVPLSYLVDGTAVIGDKISLFDKELEIAGFLRDSQMNSSLASSKRFLVSKKDYLDLKPYGHVEYLIEFRLKDLSRLSDFDRAYASSGLEANGPTITYPLFKMINALSEGLMIAVILLVSLLVVAIAFMCIRFSLLAKIEDDYREIGVLKAIGLHVSDIKKIYLVKYTVLSFGGSLLGLVLSLLSREWLLENIRLYMSGEANTSFDLILGAAGVFIVFLSTILYINILLRRFGKISASEAIRFGSSKDKASVGKYFLLSSNRLLSANAFLGIKDVLSRKKIYLTKLTVLIIAAFIIIVPMNLYNTISSESFIGYMGSGDSDIRIDIQQTADIQAKSDHIYNILNEDEKVSRLALFSAHSFGIRMTDGSEKRLKIELGDHSLFPVKYSRGRTPLKDDELALSVMNAEDLGLNLGDNVILLREGTEIELTVCGFYSDFTNGGKTAKASFAPGADPVMWNKIYVDITDKSMLESIIHSYSSRFPYAKVSNIDQYIEQTFGSTIKSIEKASYASILVALAISSLITLLFMKMLIAKDRQAIAAIKAFGFTTRDVQIQYVARSLFILALGLIAGTILANTIGEKLAGALIASFGASSFQFEINWIQAYLLPPVLLAGTVGLSTLIATSKAGEIKISDCIKE